MTLPEARNGTAVTTKNSAVVCIKATGNGTTAVYRGEVLTDENRIATANLEDQEQALVSYVEEEFASGKQQVLLRAESSVRHRDVSRVMTAIGNIEGASIYVAVLERR